MHRSKKMNDSMVYSPKHESQAYMAKNLALLHRSSYFHHPWKMSFTRSQTWSTGGYEKLKYRHKTHLYYFNHLSSIELCSYHTNIIRTIYFRSKIQLLRAVFVIFAFICLHHVWVVWNIIRNNKYYVLSHESFK